MKKPYVPKRVLCVQIPIELYDKLDAFAEQQKMTKTNVVIRILQESVLMVDDKA